MINIQETLEDGTRLYGWKSEPPLTPFAPSYTHYITEKKIFSSEECKDWYKYLLEQAQNTLPYNTLEFDFHLVPKLKEALLEGIETVLRISDNTDWQETLYAGSWFNILKQEQSMQPHFHGYHKNSFYGFNLMISTNETKTTFYHPVVHPYFETEHIHITNECGHLVLFPDYIPHGVGINRMKSPRISIAGDLFTSKWFETENETNNNTRGNPHTLLGKVGTTGFGTTGQ